MPLPPPPNCSPTFVAKLVALAPLQDTAAKKSSQMVEQVLSDNYLCVLGAWQWDCHRKSVSTLTLLLCYCQLFLVTVHTT